MNATSQLDDKLIQELSEKQFRDAYMADQVRTGIAYQVRAMREQPERNWTQIELGERMPKKKPQSAIARIEDPDYGRVSLTTLLELASAFDVAITVQFVEWDEFLERTRDVSPSALEKQSFDLDSREIITTSEVKNQEISDSASQETDLIIETDKGYMTVTYKKQRFHDSQSRKKKGVDDAELPKRGYFKIADIQNPITEMINRAALSNAPSKQNIALG